MKLFSRPPKTLTSPWGEASLNGEMATVPFGRFRGICIDLIWKLDDEPSAARVEVLKRDLLTYWDKALEFLGVDEFPRDLSIVVPESVFLNSTIEELEITFVCPKWKDGYWTVVFRDGKPVRLHDGD